MGYRYDMVYPIGDNIDMIGNMDIGDKPMG